MRFLLASSVLMVTLAFAVAPTAGCLPNAGGDEGEGEGEEGEGEGGGDGDCPVAADGVTVCDVQDGNSPNAVAVDGQASLVNVVAASPSYVIDTDDVTGDPSRYGVFVSDDPVDDRSGVHVTYFADLPNRPANIAIGDVLTIEGTVDEFALGAPHTETRIQATSITLAGNNVGDLAPVVVTAADLSEDAGEDWEGTLVRLDDVTITEIGEFGQFTLSNGIIVDDSVFHYPAVAGEVLESITGVVGYNVFTGGGFRLLTRQITDVVSIDRPVNSVTELNDGTLPRCAFDQAFDCPSAIGDAVVTSPIVFVNDDNDAFDLFVFFVADAANKDGNNRLGPYSGLRVSVRANPQSPGARSGNYTWEQDQDQEFLPGAAPEIGDVIELAGLNTEDFAEGEYEASFINKTTDVVADPTKLVLPALFTGAEAAALKGGRPTFNGDWPGLEDLAPAANIEQWEGALVELSTVSTINECFEQPTPFTNPTRTGDFGNWLVTGDVEIGNDFFLFPGFAGSFDMAVAADQRTCATARTCDSRVLDQDFTSLTGIMRFKFGRHLVSPRLTTDVQPQALFVACP